MTRAGFREITARNDIARDIIAGFAAATPTLAGAWRIVDTALADVPVAVALVGKVRADLEAVRLDRANLLAAIRATLGAWADGEDDPLWYLRDELDAHQMPSQRHRRAS
jgi:hydroxymethylglutaryl-CoA reductase